MMNLHGHLLVLLTAFNLATLKRTAFNQILRCPTTNATLHPFPLTIPTQCALVCAAQPKCNIFFFEPNTNKCYLGDACFTATQWTNGSCVAYKYSQSLSDDKDTDNSSQLFQQLQMKLFYKFKTSGVVNEVNPREFCLTARNVTVGSNGAVFRGDSNSYLMTETPGFSQMFDYGNNYSMYMAVQLNMDLTNTSLFKLHSCNGIGAYSISFVKLASDLNVGFHKSDRTYGVAQVKGVLPKSNHTALMSAGFVFHGTNISYFYLNGTRKNLGYGEFNYSSSFNAQYFNCLTLGLGSKYPSLNGTMHCFGLSKIQMQIGDFKNLENYYCFG